ncbi:MAG: hypothetical protein KC613_14880 [Myxococcales bacterium]|nr:hypothetical protein [Myxococcales bacterium]
MDAETVERRALARFAVLAAYANPEWGINDLCRRRKMPPWAKFLRRLRNSNSPTRALLQRLSRLLEAPEAYWLADDASAAAMALEAPTSLPKCDDVTPSALAHVAYLGAVYNGYMGSRLSLVRGRIGDDGRAVDNRARSWWATMKLNSPQLATLQFGSEVFGLDLGYWGNTDTMTAFRAAIQAAPVEGR